MESGEFAGLRGLKILVTGGCGYIGSHAVWHLIEVGVKVVVIDTLEFGNQSNIDSSIAKPLLGRELEEGELSFYQGSIGDANLLETILQAHKIDAVLNFAAYIEVGESVLKPLNYYENNTVTVITLLKALVKHQVKYFVQSSTAAVYGEVSGEDPITEDYPTIPINPYGQSKLMVEKILKDCSRTYGLKYACFRYFNVCGYHPSGLVGEYKQHETHLLPLAIRAADNDFKLRIFGTDYDTRDGTCIRDYIDMQDLIRSHLMGLEHLMRPESSNLTLNLGSSKGYSVQEIIDSVKKVTGRQFEAEAAGRREGDPKILVASNARASEVLGWKPLVGIEESIANSWKLYCRLKGYSK